MRCHMFVYTWPLSILLVSTPNLASPETMRAKLINFFEDTATMRNVATYFCRKFYELVKTKNMVVITLGMYIVDDDHRGFTYNTVVAIASVNISL